MGFRFNALTSQLDIAGGGSSDKITSTTGDDFAQVECDTASPGEPTINVSLQSTSGSMEAPFGLDTDEEPYHSAFYKVWLSGTTQTGAGTTELDYSKKNHRFLGTAPSGNVAIDAAKSGDEFFIYNGTASDITFNGATFNGASSFELETGKYAHFIQFDGAGSFAVQVFGVEEVPSGTYQLPLIENDLQVIPVASASIDLHTAQGSTNLRQVIPVVSDGGTVTVTEAIPSEVNAERIVYGTSDTDMVRFVDIPGELKLKGSITLGDGDYLYLHMNETLGYWVEVARNTNLSGDVTSAGDATTLKDNLKIRTIGCTIDGGSSAPAVNTSVFVFVPYACTITGWYIGGDVSGSAVVDVLTATYGNRGTEASIAGSEKPTLSSVIENRDIALGTWSPNIAAGTWVQFKVSSASTLTKIYISLAATAT